MKAEGGYTHCIRFLSVVVGFRWSKGSVELRNQTTSLITGSRLASQHVSCSSTPIMKPVKQTQTQNKTDEHICRQLDRLTNDIEAAVATCCCSSPLMVAV